MAEAISLAKELNDSHALAGALHFGAILRHLERNTAEVERLVSELIELSTRHNFALWLAGGEIFGGWARSVSGSTAEGIAWIEDGIRDYRAAGSRQKQWSKDLKSAGRVPNCTGCAVCFWQLLALTTPKLRLRSAKPLTPHGSRNRFR
jgi:hypothetical protein